MKKQRELNKTLQSIDEKSYWNQNDRLKLKQSILSSIDQQDDKRSHKRTPFVYYGSLITACLFIFILLVPFIQGLDNNDQHASSTWTGNASADGFSFDLISIKEGKDGATVVLQIENKSEYDFIANEIFIKNLDNQVFTDEDRSSWSYQPEDKYVDKSSLLLKTKEREGSFDEIKTGEKVEIEFFVPNQYRSEQYQLMYQSYTIPLEPGRDKVPGRVFHTIDLQNRVITKYEEPGNIGGFARTMIPILFIVGLLFIALRLGKTTQTKVLLVFAIITIATLGHFTKMLLTDDQREIEQEALETLSSPMTDVVHIEMLNSKEALVFYEWGGGTEVFLGSTIVKKTLLGWHSNGGGASQIASEQKYETGYSGLELRGATEYVHLLKGKVLDEAIAEVRVVVDDKELTGNIVEYAERERLWYIVSNNANIDQATVYWLSEDGEIVEQSY
ncbi:hypothetical protein [Radiobacillus sp. PE A8.2]|uniref:hypothetical protein n=1 Tax=Radiobacillus sp. PE A8.2 TaxID=3380349 RepID=UPI00388D8657